MKIYIQSIYSLYKTRFFIEIFPLNLTSDLFLHQGSKSHKSVDPKSNLLMQIYYTNRWGDAIFSIQSHFVLTGQFFSPWLLATNFFTPGDGARQKYQTLSNIIKSYQNQFQPLLASLLPKPASSLFDCIHHLSCCSGKNSSSSTPGVLIILVKWNWWRYRNKPLISPFLLPGLHSSHPAGRNWQEGEEGGFKQGVGTSSSP